MNISTLCILRPKATLLLTFGGVLLGLWAYGLLPVAALPQVDFPTIVVSTSLPGASPQVMAQTVTTPLERQLGQIPALAQITSMSGFSSSQITMQFDLDRKMDAAEQDVQAAIQAASNLLPSNLPAPPIYSKSNPADAPILTLALSSSKLSLRQLADVADSVVLQKLSQVSGVGLVRLLGGSKPAIRVRVDHKKISGLGLTMADIQQLLLISNVNQPKGSINGAHFAYALQTDDQLFLPKDYQELVLAYVNGAPIRLQDVAEVVEGVENNFLAGWADGQPAMLFNVYRQPGVNIIDVVKQLRQQLPRIVDGLPEAIRQSDIHLAILSDRSTGIQASMDDVYQTLLLTIFLVVLVIYLFLQDALSTLIPAVTLPLAILLSFFVMWFLGLSLNNLSLMALTIAVGFVVDDAIVMVENIDRYLKQGLSPQAAAIKGASEIGFTIVSLTFSLLAVLIPLLMMDGMVGRIFHEFAITLSIVIVISALLSLTVTPMMAAQLLSHHPALPAAVAAKKSAWLIWQKDFKDVLESSWQRLYNAYDSSLKIALAHPSHLLFVTLAAAFGSMAMAYSMPKGFFPLQDTALVAAISQAEGSVSFERMKHLQKKMGETLLEDKDIQHVVSFMGIDGENMTMSTGRFLLMLKDKKHRQSSMSQMMQRLQQKNQDNTAMNLFMAPVQDVQLDTQLKKSQYQYTITSADLDKLLSFAPQILEALQALAEICHVDSDSLLMGEAIHLRLDRLKAGLLGVSSEDVDTALYQSFGQAMVNRIFTELNIYKLILEISPGAQGDLQILNDIYVRSRDNELLPLTSIATVEKKIIPLLLHHQGQLPSLWFSFDLTENVSLNKALEAIDKAMQALQLPDTLKKSFTGDAKLFDEALNKQPWLIAAALLAVYIVLGVLYESYLHPLTILSTLPSAGLGAFLSLRLMGMPLDVMGLIGLILLIGIVKKNAIMMIDFALEKQRHQKRSAQQAIYEACLLRFRPIMMTTMAALLGALPLAFGQGIGSELRAPLGVAILGGLLISQWLTLYTTPVIYLYMAKLFPQSEAP